MTEEQYAQIKALSAQPEWAALEAFFDKLEADTVEQLRYTLSKCANARLIFLRSVRNDLNQLTIRK
jgi:hypothetical protein